MLGVSSDDAMPQFSSLPDSMYYLFLSAALGDDITDFAQDVRDRSLFMTMMLFVLVVLATECLHEFIVTTVGTVFPQPRPGKSTFADS